MTVTVPPPVSDTASPPLGRWPWLQVFTSWRMLAVAMLGFASGLPMALTGTAMQAWLVKEGYDLGKIGWLGYVALPYSLKFLWSPFMDRFVPPFLGRRRGWVLICQVVLIGAILCLAAVGVSPNLTVAAVLLTAVAFCSASQDIAIDAYRTDLLEPVETGAGSAAAIMGWRVGFICSGAVALVLADHFSWQVVYAMMAGCMGATLVVAFLAPEPRTQVQPPRTFEQAVVLPFWEFLKRRGAWEMLLFILIYKLDWAMVYWAATPFVQKTLLFQQSEIGAVNGIGMVVTIIGAAVGGALLTMIGMRRSLLWFGVLQGLAGASYAALAVVGKDYVMLATATCVENFFSGMATAAFTGFLMTLCDKRFTATQFALLSSLFALSRTLISAPAGWFTQDILNVGTDPQGWQMFFICSILVSLPGLLLLLRYNRWQMPVSEPIVKRQS